MATQWHYKTGGEERGPVPSPELKRLATTGQLTPDDLVWKEGLTEWVRAAMVQGLFNADAANSAAALSGTNLGAALPRAVPLFKKQQNSPPAIPANRSHEPVVEVSQAAEGRSPASLGSSENAPSTPAPREVNPAAKESHRAAPEPATPSADAGETAAVAQAASASDATVTKPASRRRNYRVPVIALVVAASVLFFAGTFAVSWMLLAGSAAPPLDEQAWLKSDFILASSEGVAVAVDYEADEDLYRVVAKVQGRQANQVIALATEAGATVVQPDDQNLAAYVHRRHEAGERIEDDLGRRISVYWPIDRRPWTRATFVLYHPKRFAVALAADGPDRFRFLGKAAGDDAETVAKIASDAGLRLLEPDADERLVADAFRLGQPDSPLSSPLAKRIQNYWPLDRRPWLAADFLLLDGDEYAVAVDYQAPDQFYVLQAARGYEARAVNEMARDTKVTVVATADDRLAADVYRQCPPGEPFDRRLNERLLQFWPINKALWRQADFVMVNPTELATAIKCSGDDRYELLAVADPPNSPQAVQFAWKSRIPIIARDPPLTRRVYDGVLPGEQVDQVTGRQISQYWKQYSFLPSQDEFISFRDVKLDKWQVAFLLNEEPDRFLIHPLSYDTPSAIPTERVQPGSLEKASGKYGLRELQHVELLDYCAVQIARALETQPGKRSHLYLVVNPVKVDLNEEELRFSKTQDVAWADDLFALGARTLGEGYRHDPRKEPARILRSFAESVQSGLQAKLSQLHVPLLEREELDKLLRERGRAAEGFEMSDIADQPLLGPSHIVFSEIRHRYEGGELGAEVHSAAQRGEFELSVRLVDVGSGEIIWTDQMTRRKITEAPQLTNYLLDNGDLTVLELRERTKPAAPQRGESWPIALPPLPLSSTNPNGFLAPRLGYLEQNGSETYFRDLFSKRSSPISANLVTTRQVSRFEDVPNSHQMRYLVWQLAHEILPLAGRVTDIDGKEAKISLGAEHGLRTGSILRVVRMNSAENESTLTAQNMLQIQLRVAETQQRGSRVFITNPGRDELQPADIVYTQQSRPVAAAIVPPRFVIKDITLQKQLSLWKEPQHKVMVDQTMNRVHDLTNRLSDAMNQLDVPMKAEADVQSAIRGAIDGNAGLTQQQARALADQLGLTHLVYGEISPTLHIDPKRTADRLILNLKVLDTESSRVVVIPQIVLTARQFENWQP